MKYNININQEKLIEIEPQAKLIDGAILDYLYWLCNSTSEEVEKLRKKDFSGLRYTWVNYEHLLEDMPLLKGRNKSSLTPVFQRLEEWGFIKTMILNNQMKYVSLLSKMDKLFRKQNSSVLKTKQSCLKNRTYKYTNNKDTINKKSNSSFKNKKKPYYDGQHMWKDSHDKWWVIRGKNDFLEFAGSEKDIEWK